MLSFFVTSFAEQFTVFLIGMIILTFGEMFVWPAVPTIANYLAPGKQGQYQGVVNSASTVGKAFGPLIGGILVDTFNMSAMFIGMIILLLIGMFSYLFLIRVYQNIHNMKIVERQLEIKHIKYAEPLAIRVTNIILNCIGVVANTFLKRASGGAN